MQVHPADVLARELEKLEAMHRDKLITDNELAATRKASIDKFNAGPLLLVDDRDGPDPALKDYFKAQEDRRVHPWRVTADALAAERAAMATESLDALRTQFLEHGKAGMLSPDTALVIHYLLYATPEEQRVFAAMMLRKDAHQLIVAHNFWVAQKREASFALVHGNSLPSMHLPLWPPVAEFSAMNTMLLSCFTAPSGGSADASDAKAGKLASLFRMPTPIGGEFWVPVTQTPQGPGVDIGAADDAMRALHKRIANIERDIASVRRSSNGSGRGRGNAQDGGDNGNRAGFGERRRGGPRGAGDTSQNNTQAPRTSAAASTAASRQDF